MDPAKKIDIEDIMWRDDRGWGLNPFAACHFIPSAECDIHVVSLEPGAVRGNHRHAAGTEWMLICGGPASIRVRWENDGPVETMVSDGGTPLLIEIPSPVEHAVRNDSEERICLVVFSDVTAPEAIRCSSLFE